jgi:predicted RNA-binding Zn-ribbon protein involved in translation (DUF1610 family)
MTPTLSGRWQIRLFLLPTVGLIITLLVGLVIHNYLTPLWALLYVLVFGLIWDILYQFITSFRWDRDWPTSWQVLTGIIEGALIWVLIITVKLPGIPKAPPFPVFLIQYGLIWLSIFLLLQGPLRLFFLSWRYNGGQWIIAHQRRPYQPAVQSYPDQQRVGIANPLEPPPPIAAAFAGGPQAQYGGPQPGVQPQVQLPQGQVQYAGPRPGAQPQVQYAGPQPGPYVDPSVSAFPTQPQVQFAGPNAAPFMAQPQQGGTVQASQPFGQPYTCANCGVVSDRNAGNFCPNCGKVKV